MTELEVRNNDQGAVAVPTAPQQQITTKSALVIWAEEARVVANIADSIAKTPFAGQLRGKPLEVTAVILAGNELGLKPMAALKSVDIIQGTPALRAHAMRGLLQSHGHEIEVKESDAQHCVMRGRRKGAENWQEVTWTIERAALLGLVNKPEWKKQPGTMLVARATGEMCRLIASDALHGMPYAAEELAGATEIRVEQVQTAPLSVAAITAAPEPQGHRAPPRATQAPSPVEDEELAPHEWDIHTLAATLGMSEKDLEERCYGVTGGSLAEASEAQHQALFKELANEMVARDNQRAQ